MNNPKVLFIFFQSESLANGGTTSLSQIIFNLRQVEPMVITQIETPLNEVLRKKGVKVIIMSGSFTGKFKKLISIIRFQFKLFLFLRKHNFTAVHVNDINALIHAGRAVKLCKLKLVFNVRDIHAPNKSYDSKWQQAKHCDHIIGLSQDMKNELVVRLPIPDNCKNNITYIYSIVDFNIFKSDLTVDKISQTNGKFNVLYAATFNDKKNQLDFINHALPLTKLSNIHVHFVGDFNPENDAYAKKCLDALSSQDSSNYTLHGYQEDMSRYYRIMDLTVVPTRKEGLARCMIESISCGTPVISFDVSSAKEILQEHHCGSVVSQGDYDFFIKEIERLKNDQFEWKTCSINGVDLSRKLFGFDCVIEEYEGIYLTGK
jgi:glycosyltransferase involved in cell wall biosynthesis